EGVQPARAIRLVRLRHVTGNALACVPLEGGKLRDVLAAALIERANGKVEDLDRVPAAERDQIVGQRLVVPAPDADVGVRSVRRLEVRAQRVRMELRRAEPCGHAFGEE